MTLAEVEYSVAPLKNYIANASFRRRADLVRTFQCLFEHSVIGWLRSAMAGRESEPLALGGGCALNLTLNTLIRNQLCQKLAISPACNDAGQALGAALYAARVYSGEIPRPFPARSNGLEPSEAECSRAISSTGLTPEPFDPEKIADRLAGGAVLAFMDGTSALGPRALGERSLLANPVTPGMRQRLSEKIKQREWFRPLSPMMRAESLTRLVPGAKPSPYMLFSYDLPSKMLPEATHIDNTARVQTLDPDSSPRLLAVLDAFERKTGVPALINTSLNRRGRAIAYTPEHVIDDFASEHEIEQFVFGPWMASRNNMEA
jgi:carbamoyltransferase